MLGTCWPKHTHAAQIELEDYDQSITDMIVRKELTIRGSLIYTDEFPEALAILQSGKVKTAPLATGKVTLPELDQVLGAFASPERIKTLVEI